MTAMTAPAAPVAAQAERSQALDDLIMGTNSSSIVSKRSVERLYYPDEPHYFRYFVKKFQRRAPLINRGYWLRLRAIDVVVREFLVNEQKCKKKVVINLGCGSDVLPWQSHVRHGAACRDALFIDIDYPDLMKKKRAIVLETPQLRQLLGEGFSHSSSEEDPILIRSDRYCQIGCDLRELTALREILESLVDLSECAVLFVAEVSVTYMDTDSADNLVQWASSVGKAEFCLLEQLLPYGPGHPFAQTMLKHFEKLKTPPRSVGQYLTLDQQRDRFKSRGWLQVKIWDLWQAWSSDEFVGPQERAALDDVEPFDEWEEFMLFARHYFVLHAYASGNDTFQTVRKPRSLSNFSRAVSDIESPCIRPEKICSGSKRRFGAATVTLNALGQKHILDMLGLGANAREDSYDVYALDEAASMPHLPFTGPSPRMCHTLTDLGVYGKILIGGRGSPASPFSDCWIMSNGEAHTWKPAPRLPVPLYRHSALRLSTSSLILVSGGKTGPSSISEDYFVFHPENGWQRCLVSGTAPKAAFGSILCNTRQRSGSESRFHGIIAGGIGEDGLILTDKLNWCLDVSGDRPVIAFKPSTNAQGPSELSLFGACAVEHNYYTVVCGGMGADPSRDGRTLIVVSASEETFTARNVPLLTDDESSRPFMIGSSAVLDGNDLIIFGGGATCFSMGTFWDTGVYVAKVPDQYPKRRCTKDDEGKLRQVKFVQSHRAVSTPASQRDAELQTNHNAKPTVREVPRRDISSAAEFQEILRDAKPIILQSLSLGQCLQDWTPEHMIQRVGSEKQVTVHECQRHTSKMDFNAKNFNYITDSFGSIMKRVQVGDRIYLRSLSMEKPSGMPAKLEDDFPALATEFRLPEQLNYVVENMFSSVLRLSGRVDMWLHYDVMANVYAQISGSKNMVLFPPSDVSLLAFAPGASSSSIDVFASLESPALAATHPQTAHLNPGDVLFLPPLWLHTAKPTTDMSVAVNVFFRDLDAGYSTGRDVYGNRDLAAYEKGRQDVSKIGKTFLMFPEETRRFYLARLADELLQQAEGT